MKYEKLWIFLVVYIAVVVTLLVFALSSYNSIVNADIQKLCEYPTKSDCRNSIDGYLRTYDWMDGWSQNCQREGKIFTVESNENGTLLNPRCAIEE